MQSKNKKVCEGSTESYGYGSHSLQPCTRFFPGIEIQGYINKVLAPKGTQSLEMEGRGKNRETEVPWNILK